MQMVFRRQAPTLKLLVIQTLTGVEVWAVLFLTKISRCMYFLIECRGTIFLMAQEDLCIHLVHMQIKATLLQRRPAG
jgi:hypothetical protein